MKRDPAVCAALGRATRVVVRAILVALQFRGVGRRLLPSPRDPNLGVLAAVHV